MEGLWGGAVQGLGFRGFGVKGFGFRGVGVKGLGVAVQAGELNTA